MHVVTRCLPTRDQFETGACMRRTLLAHHAPRLPRAGRFRRTSTREGDLIAHSDRKLELEMTAAEETRLNGSVGVDDVEANVSDKKQPGAPGAGKTTAAATSSNVLYGLVVVLAVVCCGLLAATIALAVNKDDDTETVTNPLATTRPPAGTNVCAGKKPSSGFENFACVEDEVVQALEQAAANVTRGYNGDFETDAVPITEPYWKMGLCPVNVHWHLGAEHYSHGEFDNAGTGPSDINERRRLAGETREGHLCHHYDETDEKFTKEYDWQHCIDMEVGQTYEVHWPHSAAGACGTLNQYQTPFYDGVFCTDEVVGGMLDANDPRTTYNSIGVQGQVFVIVNDEDYYYPDLMRGMIVDGDFGTDLAMYTGSTTGTSRNNEVCSAYTPITWQVDRKCHMISASSFDKMCADMKAQRDDMSDDLYAHGSRELVADFLAANNHATRA
mmetsp:Transcript_1050/g.2887  ORF Transcript_1050/g.2887 Transcript_1050/m.2887 type:complete len:443 (-) Transcript_1050:254-1582(-)